jgi:hypothetical protein
MYAIHEHIIIIIIIITINNLILIKVQPWVGSSPVSFHQMMTRPRLG